MRKKIIVELISMQPHMEGTAINVLKLGQQHTAPQDIIYG